ARDVDLVDGWRPHDVDALFRAHRDVARLIPRVLPEVVRLAELTRIDEDRHDRRRVLGAGSRDERSMTGVEPAHRRHETDRSGCGGEGRPELGPGPDDARI